MAEQIPAGRLMTPGETREVWRPGEMAMPAKDWALLRDRYGMRVVLHGSSDVVAVVFGEDNAVETARAARIAQAVNQHDALAAEVTRLRTALVIALGYIELAIKHTPIGSKAEGLLDKVAAQIRAALEARS